MTIDKFTKDEIAEMYFSLTDFIDSSNPYFWDRIESSIRNSLMRMETSQGFLTDIIEESRQLYIMDFVQWRDYRDMQNLTWTSKLTQSKYNENIFIYHFYDTNVSKDVTGLVFDILNKCLDNIPVSSDKIQFVNNILLKTRECQIIQDAKGRTRHIDIENKFETFLVNKLELLKQPGHENDRVDNILKDLKILTPYGMSISDTDYEKIKRWITHTIKANSFQDIASDIMPVTTKGITAFDVINKFYYIKKEFYGNDSDATELLSKLAKQSFDVLGPWDVKTIAKKWKPKSM